LLSLPQPQLRANADIVDVIGDGNCFYRAVAVLLGLGEEGYPLGEGADGVLR
jgi:hypothetical protein